MKPGSVKITDRLSAVEAIKGLDEEDLRFLNGLIVERLKLISQAHATMDMATFAKGDRVRFYTREGELVEGIVLRLNKKTISVVAGEDAQWNVSPGYLELIQSVRDVP